jgi:hypothetical protein
VMARDVRNPILGPDELGDLHALSFYEATPWASVQHGAASSGHRNSAAEDLAWLHPI